MQTLWHVHWWREGQALARGRTSITCDLKGAHDATGNLYRRGDQEGAQACRAALQQIPAPETPDIRLIFNPEGLSNTELEKLAHLATSEALDKLQQALIAHEKRLEEAKQHKTGRSALVGAQKKRIKFIQELLATCAQRRHEQESS